MVVYVARMGIETVHRGLTGIPGGKNNVGWPRCR
jgi:hypothetical protein